MTSSAVRTAARVPSEMPGLSLSTRLTVASLTPACLATSARFPATLQVYGSACRDLQVSAGGSWDSCRHEVGMCLHLRRKAVPCVLALAEIGVARQGQHRAVLLRDALQDPVGGLVLRTDLAGHDGAPDARQRQQQVAGVLVQALEDVVDAPRRCPQQVVVGYRVQQL